ncbi:uncharacterized protein STEHIDRAFT_158479 [Stereum hirsutum FP-91666 SS1]|uniref:uncharacterized protein n=1 Tax=Stereum hirsutum (strain FP-91666) TaxID=721885 RepID=UPI0004449447|nr:uncharacterized protein STEHIDRAFT_158479 [Stereum hirsutum FP-91666 SS1]EIM84764.1 hypothetical protein STEHIDRAFT_158479 [Stereum hirsutum FP-91666 SS1]
MLISASSNNVEGGTLLPPKRRPEDSSVSFLGPVEAIAEGDTYLVENILPEELGDVAFERLKAEVKWSKMFHRGGEVPRLVAVEGEVESDGTFPIYRHPSDSSPPLLPFSPTVSLIRRHVEQILGHPVNHVLIQFYRTGADYISEHSDKTIDIVQGSSIVNISLGAQRVMTLRTKKDRSPLPPSGSSEAPNKETLSASKTLTSISTTTARSTQRVPLPHNSMFVLGLATNARWTHSIHTDKRPLKLKSPVEQFQNGERISLTFRHIGTFLMPSKCSDGTIDTSAENPGSLGPDTEVCGGMKIYGQGAKGKSKEEARPVMNGGEEAEKLIAAFGRENRESSFVWEDGYGEGFDVLHFTDEK